jgi:hypothetical protein
MPCDLEMPADTALLCFLKACSVLAVISVYWTVVSGGAVGSPARAWRHTLAIHLPCVCALSVSLRTQRNRALPAL